MPSVPDMADGCAKILELLLHFLGSPSPRSRAVVQAVVSLLVVLSMAYVAGVIVKHFAGVVLAYLHLASPAPATAESSAYLGRFVGLFFTLVFAWIIVIAVLLAAFVFLARRYARDWAGVQLG